jgi:outer membrane protein assembly factor BamB
MNAKSSMKGCITRGIIGLVVLELIIFFLIPVCREAELMALYGTLNHYFLSSSASLRTSQEPIALTAYGNMLSASVLQALPDDHTYLFNTHNGALQVVLSNNDYLINADQYVYFTYHHDTLQSDTLAALRLSDNTPLWHHTFTPSPLSFTTQLQDGILFFASAEEGGTGPSVLYAFSEQSGTMLWHYIVPQSNGFFYTVNNGSVYILGRLGIEALSINNGTMRWFDQINTTGMYDIVADNMNVYILGEAIQALRTTDGQLLWNITQNRAPYPYFYYYLGLQSGVLYTSDDRDGTNSEINAIRVQDGKILWSVDLRVKYSKIYPQQDASNVVNIISFTKGNLYWLVNSDVYAFRGTDGQQSWHFQGQKTSVPNQSLDSQLLAATNDITYIQIYNKLVALQSSSGQPLWTIALPALSGTKAVINGSDIFYGYAVHSSNVPPPPHFVLSVISAFPLYQCQNTIHLFALQAQTGMQQWQKRYTVACTI